MRRWQQSPIPRYAQQFLGKAFDVVGKRIEVIMDTPCHQSPQVFPCAAQAAILQKSYLLSLRHFFNYTTEPTCKTKSEIPAPHFHPHIFLPGITLTEKVMPPPERKNQPIHLRGSGLFLLMSLNPPAGDLPPAPFCQKETPWVNLVHSTGNPVQIGGLKHGANPHQSGRFPPVFLKLRHRVSMPKACRNRVFLPAWNRIPRVKTTG